MQLTPSENISMSAYGTSAQQLWAKICEDATWGAAVMRADDNTLLMTNHAFARMHKWNETELLGKPYSVVLAPKSRHRFSFYMKRADQRSGYGYESTHVRRNGDQFTALTDVTTLKDFKGRTAYRAVIVRDIGKWKRAAQRHQHTVAELKNRLQERTATLRRMSGQLLRAQDDEHRRIARELHDSIGQYLTALKIDLDQLAGSASNSTASEVIRQNCLSECLRLVEICLNETRTLSHLLHPPLLDEAGLTSATRWYVAGFAKRSGVQVDCVLPQERICLPSAAELALFRTLQETLTNVYRHSGSKTAAISLVGGPNKVVLRVCDAGRGMDPAIVREFQERGTGVGVGLAGIRERMTELDGDVDIRSDAHGTTVTATIPLPRRSHASDQHLPTRAAVA
jgi:PAS domain S-box-containing protein